MQRALCKSSVAASDVAYINAHATSTPLGDAVEAAAIAKLFNFPQKDTAEKLMAHAMEPTVGKFLDIDPEKKVHWRDFESPFLPPRVKACWALAMLEQPKQRAPLLVMSSQVQLIKQRGNCSIFCPGVSPDLDLQRRCRFNDQICLFKKPMSSWAKMRP